MAQQEANRLNHRHIDTEHLLLGLLKSDDSLAFEALNLMRVTYTRAISSIVFVIGVGKGVVTEETPFTARLKEVFELAEQAAKDLEQNDVNTIHLLLGLIDEGHNLAVRILEALGINLDRMQQTLRQFASRAEPLNASDQIRRRIENFRLALYCLSDDDFATAQAIMQEVTSYRERSHL